MFKSRKETTVENLNKNLSKKYRWEEPKAEDDNTGYKGTALSWSHESFHGMCKDQDAACVALLQRSRKM